MIKYKYAGKTDIGLERKVNQDSFGSVKTDWGSVFVLSDGFGHRDGGKLASQSAVDILIDKFSLSNPGDEIKSFLNDTLEEINKYIYFKKISTFDRKMMGCTVVVLILTEKMAYVAHIGDSRIYIISDKKLKRLTNDHSYIQDLMNKGALSAEKAKTHSKRHVLTKALGSYRYTNPDYDHFPIKSDDIFMLCCDGVWGPLSGNDMEEILLNNKPSEATTMIINTVKGNLGSDNITAQVISLAQDK